MQVVICALQAIGLSDVRDVDADAEAAGDSGPRREDLRIMDTAKPALVEVKGITGTPKEASRRPWRRPTQQGWRSSEAVDGPQPDVSSIQKGWRPRGSVAVRLRLCSGRLTAGMHSRTGWRIMPAKRGGRHVRIRRHIRAGGNVSR